MFLAIRRKTINFLYLGTAVFDEEDYKELINNVNSVDLILK